MIAVSIIICAFALIGIFFTSAKLGGVYKDIELNSHRINSLEAEVRELKEKLVKAEVLAADAVDRIADLESQTDAVQDLKAYNEGLQNIMNYNVDVAMGKSNNGG